jgi:hypothetical protein
MHLFANKARGIDWAEKDLEYHRKW